MAWWQAAAVPRLLVHVGRHKTGSTSLQQALARADLGRFRILYPQAGRQEDQHAGFPRALMGGADGAAAPPLDGGGAIAALLNQLQQEVRAEQPRLILLSSEVFCELAKRQPERCEWLLQQLASRWPLQLLQVVRPLPDYFLSALKHQLRAGTFLRRSPFSWYRHCRVKTQLLDGFWSHAGHPLLTLPYRQRDCSQMVMQAVADCAGLRGGQQRRLQAAMPQLRANASEHGQALVSLYVLYLIRLRAWQVAGPAALPDPLPLAGFAQQLAAADPAFVAELQVDAGADQELLQLCLERDGSLPAGLAPPAGPLPGDGQADRLADWHFVQASDFYRRFRPALVQAASLLQLPDPDA